MVSDARYKFLKIPQVHGDLMGAALSPVYTKAGIVRRTGLGLCMEIAGAEYFITPDDVPALLFDKGAEVVNCAGDPEGKAWLSPAIAEKKQELTALIRERIFVVRYDEMKRVLLGDQVRAAVREYRPPG